MSIRNLPYRLTTTRPASIGLVVLQADERIENDFRRMIPNALDLLVSRVPSGTMLTRDTLARMEAHLTASADLFPRAADFCAVGYGCTSGTAEIGSARVAELIMAGVKTRSVTEPITALVAACRSLGVTSLGVLSPYVASVSNRLRSVLADDGIEVPVFGSFNEATEANVARIDSAAIYEAALDLAKDKDIDALFLSCTNLDTLEIIAPLEDALDLPVLTSNLVLAWHLCQLADTSPVRLPYRLFAPGADAQASPINAASNG
jgi:maleate isomerase